MSKKNDHAEIIMTDFYRRNVKTVINSRRSITITVALIAKSLLVTKTLSGISVISFTH